METRVITKWLRLSFGEKRRPSSHYSPQSIVNTNVNTSCYLLWNCGEEEMRRNSFTLEFPHLSGFLKSKLHSTLKVP